MNKINKSILKHILANFVLGILFFCIWLLGIYAFLFNYIKVTEYSAVEKSVLMSEVSKGIIYIPRIKPFVKELEKNKYIDKVDVVIDDYRLLSKEKVSYSDTLFRLYYPVSNKSGNFVGYIEVCPSFAMFDKLIIDKYVFLVIICFVILLLLFVSLIFYFYISKYLFSPYKQLKAIVENLYGNQKIEINKFNNLGFWKDLFINLNKLNSKVFDIYTVMKLLFSATNIKGSELELINSVQQVFKIICKRVPLSACVLLVPENGQLKVVAKRGFFKKDVVFITKDIPNYVWDTYENSLDKVINDISELDKNKLSVLCDDIENGSFASFALIDDSKGDCVGVLVIFTEYENSFSYDLIKVIKIISGYFVALINTTLYHQKIEERNRCLEAEVRFAVKELENKNNLVMRRMQNINTVFNVFSFVLSKIEMSKVKISDVKSIVEYIIEKSKRNFSVKYAGILLYDKNKDEFSSMYNSFGLKNGITFANKKNSIYNKVITTGKGVFINNNNEAEEFARTGFFETINVIYSAVFYPIKDKNGESIAMFCLVNKTDGEFNSVDLKFSENIAIMISSILKNTN